MNNKILNDKIKKIKNSKLMSFLQAFRTKFSHEGIFKESAALTFVTLLGFVPFLIFIIFLLPELPFLKIQSQIKDILISIFLPSSAELISNYIAQIIEQKISFNSLNFLILIFTSYSLFKIINDSFDRILNVHEQRRKGLLSNFVKFLGMVIFGSLLLLILFSAASVPIIAQFIEFPFLQKTSLYLTPFILLFIIFTLGFFLIPTIRVTKRSLFIGSAISAFFWIIFKSLFNWYIAHFTNFELIFGVLASIPIFLFWIYANWIIILSGVIIVSILEKRHIRPKILPREQRKLKITFEKYIGDENYDKISSTALSPEDVKTILKDFLEVKKRK